MFELSKEFEKAKDDFHHAKLLCIFAQNFLRDETQSQEYQARRAISQFNIAINKLKNLTAYDQYFQAIQSTKEQDNRIFFFLLLKNIL